MHKPYNITRSYGLLAPGGAVLVGAGAADTGARIAAGGAGRVGIWEVDGLTPPFMT